MNAIVWTAGLDVLPSGIDSEVTTEELKQKLDPK